MIGAAAVVFLREAALGTRVVVRYRLAPDAEAGASDALGDLVERSSTACTVQTRRGPVVIADADVIAAKAVPPAPEPRGRRRGNASGPSEPSDLGEPSEPPEPSEPLNPAEGN